MFQKEKEVEWKRSMVASGEEAGRCYTSDLIERHHQPSDIFLLLLGMKGGLAKGNRQVLVINCPEGTRQVSEDEDNHDFTLINNTK